jgi:hypothetical protein
MTSINELIAAAVDIEQERREFYAACEEQGIVRSEAVFTGWLAAKQSLLERLQAAEDAAKRYRYVLHHLGHADRWASNWQPENCTLMQHVENNIARAMKGGG